MQKVDRSFFLTNLHVSRFQQIFNMTALITVGSLKAKKMGKVLFSEQKYQTCRDGWEGSEKQYF